MSAQTGIAVVGIGCRLPGARDQHEFLANLTARVDAVREIPADRFDAAALYSGDRAAPNRSISKWCGLVERPYDFDHAFFGISPREARLLDPLQRLLMEVTQQCVEDAGATVAALGAARTAVYVGNMERDHMAELTSPGHEVETHSVLGVYDCLLANRISQTFGLSGASVAVDAACASSLVAVHLGVQALDTGEADYVLAGGVNLNLHPWKYVGFSKARMLSPTGRCRTFDRDADGFVPGDGVGMVLLRRLSDAVRDGDHVYGVIRGSAVNHGRRRTTITAPTVASQREVIAAAIERSGVSPAEITFVETHGTGTSLGDPIEVEALRQVFAPAASAAPGGAGWCTLGAVKSNIGHLEGAAGVAGLIKVLMMMAERRIVPNLHMNNLNPLIELADSPFRLALENAEWHPAVPGAPLLAGVSSFGFGGVNAHLVVEQYRAEDRAPRPAPGRPLPFLLSAASAASLGRLTAHWRLSPPQAPLADVCTTLAVGRTHLPYRLGALVSSPQEIAALLERADVAAPEPASAWTLRVGPMPVQQDIEAFLEEFATVIDPEVADLLRGAADEPRKQCAYTTAVIGALLRFGLRPALVVADGAGIWPALAALGALDPAAAADAAAGAAAPGLSVRLPSVPLAVPGSERVVTPFRLDAGYLAHLRAAEVQEGELGRLVELASPLEGQRTFQSNLADWRRTPAPAENRLALALSLQNALDRINRKWDLPLRRHVADERANELLDLLLDGVIEPTDVQELLADGVVQPRHPARANLADESRYATLRRLSGLPDDLAELGGWMAAPAVAPVPDGHAVLTVDGSAPLTEMLLELWQRGVDVRWCAHPVAHAGGRTSLPTTRFESVEHRVPAATAAGPGQEAPGAVVELHSVWEPTVRTPAQPAAGPVLVIVSPGADDVRRAVGRLLGRVRIVELDHLPGDADDTEAWRRALDEDGAPAAIVLACTGSAVDTAVCLLQLAKALYGRATPVLAIGSLLGGLVPPELAALAGFARSLTRETATVPIRAIALPCGLAEPGGWDLVADELGRADGADLVQHGATGRLARRFVPAPPLAPVPALPGIRPGGTYLLTGGTGGLGRLVAAHLLAVPDVRVAVVGRSPEPELILSERLAYFQADVSDPAAALGAVERIRARFGPLTGVLHAAGVLRDGYVAHKRARDLREVFAPKVLGAVNLDRATRDEPLELFVLFSSMVAVLGNPGQADYAAANAFLDQFAEAREAWRTAGERSGRTVSIGWPVWRDGGMAVTDGGVLGPQSGVLPMPVGTALAHLDRLLSGAVGSRPFFHGDPDRLPALLDLGSAAGPGHATASTAPAEGPQAGPEADTARVLDWARQHVADVIGELRGIPAGQVDLETGLDRLGLDSIVIAEFNARTEAALGSVGETLLFESRTLDAAAARIARLRPAELAARYGTAPAVAATSALVPAPASAAAGDGRADDDDVAIIGIAGRYPKAPDLDAFWRNLAQGRDCVGEIPPTRWMPGAETYSRRGAFLDGVDEFDPLFFNISPREAELMDPQERLFLETAWHAFEDAGYPPCRLGDPDRPGGRSVGVFVGVTTQTHLLWGPEQQRAGNPVVPPSPQWSVANRVSACLDLHGPSMPVDTACASSLTAVHLAVRSLAHGECAMALVGGVNLYLHPAKYDWLCSLQMLSHTGRCAAFGIGADGFVPGEGVGAALLKPLQAALADGDAILGVIKGSAINHGGRTTGYTVPSPVGQAEVIAAALADAGVDPRTVGYVEAHGTGTALGDPIEITGLTRAFADVPAGGCAIGSVKTNIGHLEAAAGIAGLTKVLLQFERGALAPSLHSREPNPRIDFAATPFRVQQEAAAWPAVPGEPRRAGISAFGAGGANAHVVLEEALQREPRRGPVGGEHLIVVSAADRERLAEHCANLSASIRARANDVRVPQIAYQLQVRREPLAERLAFPASEVAQVADRLAVFAEGGTTDDEVWVTVRDRDVRSRLRAALPGALARRDWAQVAQAWVAGVDVPWESLYDGPCTPVKLPAYPFARERYRLPELELEHPWVRERSGDGATIAFTGAEPELAEHRVDGVPVFPAAACVELICAAAGIAPGDGRVLRLRGNVWSTPIAVPGPRTLRVALGADGYQVTGQDGATHVTGKYETVPAFDLPALDLAAIRARCPQTLPGAQFYPRIRERGLDLGPTYQGIEQLCWNADEALSELCLPGGAQGCVLHPGLLDSAFQAVLWLIGNRFDRLYLPFSIGSVEVFGPLPTRAVAHVALRKATAEGCKLEVHLADESGAILVRVLDFWVRPWASAERAWSAFRPEWVEEPAGDERHVLQSALVLASTASEGTRLTAALVETGVRCTVELPGPTDFDALLAEAGSVDTVLFAWPRTVGDDVEVQLADGLLPLLACVQALLRGADKRTVRLVCAVPDDVPGYRALGGFLRTLTRESPRISHVLIVGATVEQLVAEACAADEGTEVRYRDGRRSVRRWRPFAPAQPSGPAVRTGGVYLITGGTGGLGAHVARWLARTAGADVLLAGRAPEDDRTAAVLDSVRAEGGRVRYVRADVATADGAERAVRAAHAEFGALHGVFHCAGVLRDGYVVQQNPDRLREVAAPKAVGAAQLDRAVRDSGREALDFLCLFSSVASAVGSAGQAGYAYANAYLDAFAEQRAERTVSINWPLWADGGMGVDAQAAEALRTSFGLHPLATEAGLDALAAALAGPDREVLIASGDGAALARALTAPPRQPAAVTVPAAAPATAEDTCAELAAIILAEVAQIAKIAPERIAPDRPIGDYGFDSLSFTKLANQLVTRLSVDLTPALFFEYTTIEELAAHLAESRPAPVAAHSPAPVVVTARASAPAPTPAPADDPIAIIGMHGILPGSRDLDEFWHNLESGRDLVTEIPEDRWDWRAYYQPVAGPGRTNSRWGGFLPEVDTFDAGFFGITPREAQLMDPQQRLFLQSAYKAVEEAGYRSSELARGRTGLFVGAASHDYQELLRDAGVPVEAFTTTGMFHAILANRVSYLLDLTGPSFPIDTACSSSLVALRAAVESIRAGSCDTAIVGAVNLLLSPTVYISFARAGMLSPTGRCRTFDAGADGYVRAEGVGALLLKPLSAAERDGDHVHAVIRGSAVNHGGKVNTLTTPNPAAQAELIERAFAEGDVDPATVGYLELHGTGTALGDPIEINGVKRAFARLRERTPPTRLAGSAAPAEPGTLIGSVKSNIGHPEAAAGLAGIFKVVLSMKHGSIPGNLHLREVNPQIRLDGTPLRIVDRTTPWPRATAADGTEQPRRGGVSSFGFGGANGHVLLEEYLDRDTGSAASPGTEQVFVLSARDEERLREYAATLADAVRPTARTAAAPDRELADAIAGVLGVALEDVPADEPLADLGLTRHLAYVLADLLSDQDPETLPARTPAQLAAGTVVADRCPVGDLADVAYTLQVGREPMPHRLAVVTASAAELARELEAFASTGATGPRMRLGLVEQRGGQGSVNGDPRALAEAWLAGAVVDWDAVHAGRRPRRLSLPTYPFARDRFWIPQVPPAVAPVPVAAVAPAPASVPATVPAPRPLVLGPGTADGAATVYRADLRAEDRIVAEHRVHGVPVLAGVVQLELAAAALAAHGRDVLRHRLTRVAWLRPLALADGPGDVLVRLTERAGGIAHEIRTPDGTVHSSGLWIPSDGPDPGRPPRDLDAIRARCPQHRGPNEIYELFEGLDIGYGPLFRGLRDALVGERELVARVVADTSLPQQAILHPTVLDAALQAVTVLTGAQPGETRLPFAVESVELLAAVPATGYVHVLDRGEDGHDVAVLDETGRPCVLLGQVTVRREQRGFFYRPHWQPAEARPAEPVRGPVLIVHARSAASTALADALAGLLDGPVHRLGVAEIGRPGLADRLRALGPLRHVWFLIPASDQGAGAPALALFRLVRGLAEADLIKPLQSLRSVTSGAQNLPGRRVTDPAAAGLIGLTKSLAKEYPGIGVSCVEVPAQPALAAQTARLLLAEPAHQDNREVAFVGGRRLVRTLRPVQLPPPARPVLRTGGSYLILGGAGGLGLALAEHLAAHYGARLLLAGRGPQDERIERALARLDRLGGQADYVQADLTDPAALRTAAAKARAHGPLHGVVHAAMVLRDGIVERLTEGEFKAVLGPKGEGTRVLGEVFAGEPLDFLLVLSSVQSYTGAAGQANYAAASTEQDAYTHHLAAALPFPVQSVNFGPWARVGRVADRGQSLRARGYRPIEPAEGIAALERILAAGERSLVALRADAPVLARIGVEPGPAATPAAAVRTHPDSPAERQALDEFIGDALWQRMGELGLFTQALERYRIEDLPDRLRALPRYRRLVRALIRLLVRRGLLGMSDSEVFASAAPRRLRPDPAPLRAQFPNLAARLDLVVRCLEALPDVLTGGRPATEVLFPGGSTDLVAAIYRGESLVDYCNEIVAEQVVRVGRDPRVLEVGAGTGSTTEVVLAALAAAGQAVRYDATDVSLGLLQQARARLERPGLRFRALDIERPAAAQGFADERYDVVVAGNVLHATRGLDAALAEVRSLLTPGGRLVLSEVTVVQPFHTVTFGLLDGWWGFDDEEGRLPGAPLLDVQMWRDRLEAAGFREVAALGDPAGPGALPHRVILATAAGGGAGTGQPVPAPEPVHIPAPAPVAGAAAEAASTEAAVHALVAERVAAAVGRPAEQILPDTALSGLGVDSIVAVDLTNQLNNALGIAMKTLVVFEHPTVQELAHHIATRYADQFPPAPAPAPTPQAQPAPALSPAPGATFRAVRFERPGSPRELCIVPIEPVAPGPGEIEVRVKAFPINFSDFLLAKGLYPMMPDFPLTPGVEVSGVVRRVGPGVTRFMPGQEVIALTRPTMGGQASVVLTGEDFAVAKPAHIGHEEACGFLVPFLAMSMAFERAGLRARERVFIPAAAGANGLIAVQLAQLLGAEVVATAGGPAKVAHLARLGVVDPINHHRADVVAEVLRRTGGTGVDVVVNTVAGESAQQGLDVLGPDGRYVEIAVLGLQSQAGPDVSRLVDNQSFHSFNTKKFFLRHPERREQLLAAAVEHLAEGRITPTIAHVLPFDRVLEAYAIKEDRAVIGRVVVTVPDDEQPVGRRLRELLAREFGEHALPSDAELAQLADRIRGERRTPAAEGSIPR